jgi:hypothetical protein
MRIVLAVLASVLALLVAGCDEQAWFDKFVPKEEAEVAKQVLAAFGSRDFGAIEQRLDASLAGADTRPKLEQVAEQFPSGSPKAVQVVGSNTMTMPGRVTYDLTFQCEYPDRWLLVNVVLQRADGQLKIMGVHVNRLADSLQNQNRFTFAGKGPVHWLFLALAVVIPLFIVATLVVCARTPIPRRKWLWLLFVALGLVQVSLNWSTGEWGISPVAVLLLGVGFHKAGPVAPYVLTIALPIGAVVFLLRRRTWSTAPSGDGNVAPVQSA